MSMLFVEPLAAWVPEIIRRTAISFAAGLEKNSEAAKTLTRLTCDPHMERVWAELYKRRRVDHTPGDEFLYPAIVSRASIAASLSRKVSVLQEKAETEHDHLLIKSFQLEIEEAKQFPEDRLDPVEEQDIGAKRFFEQAYSAALNPTIILVAEVQRKYRELKVIEAELKLQRKRLRKLGMSEAAKRLKKVIDFVEMEADDLAPPGPDDDDPAIVRRQRGDLRLRGLIADLSIIAETIFGTPLYGTLANVANAVLARTDLTESKIREMLRDKRPPPRGLATTQGHS